MFGRPLIIKTKNILNIFFDSFPPDQMRIIQAFASNNLFNTKYRLENIWVISLEQIFAEQPVNIGIIE
jgi:hypothetical protein